jgi:hypothetical protein
MIAVGRCVAQRIENRGAVPSRPKGRRETNTFQEPDATTPHVHPKRVATPHVRRPHVREIEKDVDDDLLRDESPARVKEIWMLAPQSDQEKNGEAIKYLVADGRVLLSGLVCPSVEL